MLTDNGTTSAEQPRYRGGLTDRYGGGHVLDRVCKAHGIEHWLTKRYHPWTNGQAERMKRTVKDATVQAFHYAGLVALQAHVLAFVQAYDFAKHLKALRWRTPCEAICDAWRREPERFRINPHPLFRDQTPSPASP